MPVGKILVANRGEIAVRIIRAARDLGIATVQAVSAADTEMLAAKLADEVVEIGPAHATKSYLNKDAVIRAALESGADAIHPGYGFLSENADFADLVENAGLVFIGPRADTIRTMGDKANAREHAAAAGVPVVPGSRGRLDDVEDALELAQSIGYPVMLKASAGGGGRGIRIAFDAHALRGSYAQASTEAAAAFGDGGLYLEAYIQRARHIEVQILGDGTRAIHLYERECSLQRRRQKVWEEAPAACLSTEMREELCASAVRLAELVRYRGAGTLEYLYDEARGQFFFIEMNTRIQVEHPITEMITGVDLVQEMIRISGGERLRYSQENIVINGHAIEVRVNAEDPSKDFRPVPGKILNVHVPSGPDVRFDSMLYAGYTIPPFYDSLLGKLIVWGETRQACMSRLASALNEISIEGVPTTIPLHRALADSADVREGNVHTEWLEIWLSESPLI